jgi:cytochrome c oxidase subunit 3
MYKYIMLYINRSHFQGHPFHLVSPSPWPILTCVSLFTLTTSGILNMGVALFIISEILFFLTIFWAYFHSVLSPTVKLGTQWPSTSVEAVNAFELPLLNTVILLVSGVTITCFHHSLILVAFYRLRHIISIKFK